MATELTKENLIEYVKKQKIKIKQLDLADSKKEKELKETKLKLLDITSQYELLQQQQQQQSSIVTNPIVSSDISKSISSFSSSFVKDFSKVFSGSTDGDETPLSPNYNNDYDLIKVNEELKNELNKTTKINEVNILLITKLEDDIKKYKIQKKKDLLVLASKDNQINELVKELQSIPYRCATSPQGDSPIVDNIEDIAIQSNNNNENENIINNLTKELEIVKASLFHLEDEMMKSSHISSSLIIEKDKLINDLESKISQENTKNNKLTSLLQASKKNIDELEEKSTIHSLNALQFYDESEKKIQILDANVINLNNKNYELKLQLDKNITDNGNFIKENKTKIIELELLLSEEYKTNKELLLQLEKYDNNSNNNNNEIVKLNNIIKENKEKISQYQDQITDISMKNSNLENSNVILESKLESNIKKVEVLTSQLSEQKSGDNDELIKLKTEIDVCKRLISSLEEEIACSEVDTINEMHINTVNELHEVIDKLKEEFNNSNKINIEKLEIERSNIIKLNEELKIYQLKVKSLEDLNQDNSLNSNINNEKEKEFNNYIDELNEEIIKLKLSNKSIQSSKETLEIKYLKEIDSIKLNILQKDETIIEINNNLILCQDNLNESEKNLKECHEAKVNKEQKSLKENLAINNDDIIKELNDKSEKLLLQLDNSNNNSNNNNNEIVKLNNIIKENKEKISQYQDQITDISMKNSNLENSNVILESKLESNIKKVEVLTSQLSEQKSGDNDELIKLKTEIDVCKRLISSLEEEIACSEVDTINEMHINTVNELHEVIDKLKVSNKQQLEELTIQHQDYINKLNDDNNKHIEESIKLAADLKDNNTKGSTEMDMLNKILLEKEEIVTELTSSKELLLLQQEKDKVSNQIIISKLENSFKELQIQLHQQNDEIIELNTVIIVQKNYQLSELERRLEESQKLIDDANFDINSRDKDLEDVETQLLELRSNYEKEINAFTVIIEANKNKIIELEELNKLATIKEKELLSNIDKIQIDLNDMIDNSANGDDKLINIQLQHQNKIENLENETALAREERELQRRRVLELEGLLEVNEFEIADIKNEYICQIEELNSEITKSNQEKNKLDSEILDLINKTNNNNNNNNTILIEELKNKLDCEINKNNDKELKITEISNNLIEFESKNKEFEILLISIKEEYETKLLTMSIQNDNNDVIVQLNSKLLSAEINYKELLTQIEKLNSIIDTNNIESEMKIDALTEKVKRMKVLLTKSKVAAQERESELELLIQSGHRPKRFGIQARVILPPYDGSALLDQWCLIYEDNAPNPGTKKLTPVTNKGLRWVDEKTALEWEQEGSTLIGKKPEIIQDVWNKDLKSITSKLEHERDLIRSELEEVNNNFQQYKTRAQAALKRLGTEERNERNEKNLIESTHIDQLNNNIEKLHKEILEKNQLIEEKHHDSNTMVAEKEKLNEKIIVLNEEVLRLNEIIANNTLKTLSLPNSSNNNNNNNNDATNNNTNGMISSNSSTPKQPTTSLSALTPVSPHPTAAISTTTPLKHALVSTNSHDDNEVENFDSVSNTPLSSIKSTPPVPLSIKTNHNKDMNHIKDIPGCNDSIIIDDISELSDADINLSISIEGESPRNIDISNNKFNRNEYDITSDNFYQGDTYTANQDEYGQTKKQGKMLLMHAEQELKDCIKGLRNENANLVVEIIDFKRTEALSSEQVAVLKENIRELESSLAREKEFNASSNRLNAEYLVNILRKFLVSTNVSERHKLVCVLCSILHLQPDETKTICDKWAEVPKGPLGGTVMHWLTTSKHTTNIGK